jgi:hypothetical protein
MEPWWVLRTGTVPFWMEFNMEPSAEDLEDYLSSREPYDHIHIMLFAHGAESIGLPPIERWQALLKRSQQEGSFIGVDPQAYPRDFAIFSRYHTGLTKIPARYPMPAPLPLNQLERFLEQAGERYAVRWQ